jgi:2-C-methyl-D-erythritol 4-phosphate cytidylyltransferase
MASVAVIVAAGGKGERFGGEERKTFASLEGTPLFLKTLEAFVNRDDVCQTILAIAPDDLQRVREKYSANLGFMGVQLAEGGEFRCQTVRNALQLVKPEAELVAVHDAARPCVTYAMIDAVFAEAAKTGAAILAAPLRGTIKAVSAAKVVDKTLPRGNLYEAQTPQVFRRDLIVRAFEQAGDLGQDITDDSQLVEALGHPVSVVESDSTNIKVTAKPDLKLAGIFYKSRPQRPVEAPRSPFEEAQW